MEGFGAGDGVTESAPLVNVDDDDKPEEEAISFIRALLIPVSNRKANHRCGIKV